MRRRPTGQARRIDRARVGRCSVVASSCAYALGADRRSGRPSVRAVGLEGAAIPDNRRVSVPSGAPAVFASLLVGAPIHDRAGEPVAAVRDLIARLDLGARERYPPLTGLVAHVGGREVFMPWALVGRLSQDGVWLARAAVDLRRFARRTGEVLLKRDVLDKQLVDVNGRRLIRAGDVLLALDGARARVVGVDVGFAALWRRAAPRALGRRVASTDLIDWQDVEYLAAEGAGVRLRGGHPKIARLHPVEI